MILQNNAPRKQADIRRVRPSHSVTAIVCLMTAPLVMGPPSAAGADATTDKSSFHLFNPTPRSLMRDLSTDRPDKTESAYTVDAGHIQLESDLVSYSRDHDTAGGSDVRVDAWAFAAINFKLGLCNRADLQVVVDSYNHVRTHDRIAGTVLKQRGFGDVTTRLKYNVWGNDEGDTALALMPWAKFPSNQDNLGNNAVEAGLIIPLNGSLPGGWSFGVMTEIDFIQNSTDTDYHAEFVNSLTFSRGIFGKLGGYIEFWSLVSGEPGVPWIGTVDLGLTYGLTEDIQFDAGINIGITRSAEDLNPFVGVTVRF